MIQDPLKMFTAFYALRTREGQEVVDQESVNKMVQKDIDQGATI
ncbi:hypothetical protein [Oceanispirochaeta sp.]|jgi:hypothetical protein|nr:hypothetical protein [Oceanispirochaeta sp.]MDA3958187.1 hypothetical protein [Oceanispirochaeta sp.]